MKIAALTDFSNASTTAVNYAIWLAGKLSADVEILHVLEISTSENSLHNWKSIETALVQNAENRAARFLATIGMNPRLSYKCLKGKIDEAVSAYAVSNSIDMVVVGSKEDAALSKSLFGSNALKIINSCPVPVVTVPSEYKSNKIENILYATDMGHLDKEIKIVARFARSFDANITAEYFTNDEAASRDRSNLNEILCRMADYRKIKFHATAMVDVVNGIRSVVESLDADLVFMFTHERGIADKLLGRGITYDVAFNIHVPLITINRTTAMKQIFH